MRPALEDRRVRMDGEVWHGELEALPIKIGHHLVHFLVRGGAVPAAKKKMMTQICNVSALVYLLLVYLLYKVAIESTFAV